MVPNYLRLNSRCAYCVLLLLICAKSSPTQTQFFGANFKLVKTITNRRIFHYFCCRKPKLSQLRSFEFALGLYYTITITIDSFFEKNCGKRKFILSFVTVRVLIFTQSFIEFRSSFVCYVLRWLQFDDFFVCHVYMFECRTRTRETWETPRERSVRGG